MKPKTRYILKLGLFIVFSIFVSLRLTPRPPIQADIDTFNGGIEWTPPVVKNRDIQGAVKTLSQKKPWANNSGSPREMAVMDWKLTGIVTVHGARIALIESGGHIMRYETGDILPGGDSILTIHKDYITVLNNDKTETFNLHEMKR